MKPIGLVMMNDNTVGVFDLDGDERITIHLDRKTSGVKDMLEFASDTGMPLSLVLTPRLDED